MCAKLSGSDCRCNAAVMKCRPIFPYVQCKEFRTYVVIISLTILSLQISFAASANIVQQHNHLMNVGFCAMLHTLSSHCFCHVICGNKNTVHIAIVRRSLFGSKLTLIDLSRLHLNEQMRKPIRTARMIETSGSTFTRPITTTNSK